MDKIKNWYNALTDENKRLYKVYAIAIPFFVLLSVGLYFFAFAEDNKVLTDFTPPEPKAVQEYKNKQDAVYRKQEVGYTDDLNKFFENMDFSKPNKNDTVVSENIYKDEEAQMDSLMIAFEKENKQPVRPKVTQSVSSNAIQNNNSVVSTKQTKSQSNSTIEKVEEKVKELTEQEKRDLARAKRRQELEQGAKSQKGLLLPKSFSASIRGTQTLKSGQLLTLITNKEVTVSGVTIPKNTYLYGTVTFSTNKANCLIKSINVNNQIVPTNMVVYSANGTKGIDIDVDANVDRGRNSAVSRGAGEISGKYGGAVDIVTDVLKGKAQEVKITFTDNQRVLIVNE